MSVTRRAQALLVALCMLSFFSLACIQDGLDNIFDYEPISKEEPKAEAGPAEDEDRPMRAPLTDSPLLYLKYAGNDLPYHASVLDWPITLYEATRPEYTVHVDHDQDFTEPHGIQRSTGKDGIKMKGTYDDKTGVFKAEVEIATLAQIAGGGVDSRSEVEYEMTGVLEARRVGDSDRIEGTVTGTSSHTQSWSGGGAPPTEVTKKSVKWKCSGTLPDLE